MVELAVEISCSTRWRLVRCCCDRLNKWSLIVCALILPIEPVRLLELGSGNGRVGKVDSVQEHGCSISGVTKTAGASEVAAQMTVPENTQTMCLHGVLELDSIMCIMDTM